MVSSTFSFSVHLLIFLKLGNSTAGDEALERFAGRMSFGIFTRLACGECAM